MIRDARETLSEHIENIEAFSKADSKRWQAFMDFFGASLEPGALDRKTKHLMIVALSACTRCDYCIVEHAQLALAAGATREELVETAFLAGTMTGAPAFAFCASILRTAIDTFAPDYGK
ncbi:MAG: carboxymuconolactone decarboxylase family protein [Dehalococcoidia bacterium]|nr:carboxymuconolactone decarboxylase family protein [Dehalococcoidia bacterium]